MNPLIIGAGAGAGIGIGWLIDQLKDKKMNYEIDFLPVGNGDTGGNIFKQIKYITKNKK